jgi:RNA polymerase sigma-70 factor (ECF subfamily)
MVSATLAEMDDAALAREIAAAGARLSSPAEAELYRRFAPRVRLYGLRHLRDPHAASDLVQQVMMTTLERLRAGEVREPDRLASFVLGMCRMTVLDLRRGVARRDGLLGTYGDSEAFAEPQERDVFGEARLEPCLAELSERERSVLLASFYADCSADEAGAALGVSAANVRVIRHRALGKLRDCMGLSS